MASTQRINQLRKLRGETTDALGQLVSTAGSGSQKAEKQARKRLTAAVQALRGHHPARVRWLVAGLTVGLLAGFAAAGLRRRLDDNDTAATQTDHAERQDEP